MCFFLTVAVPAAQVDRIAEIFGRGFTVHPTANPSVIAALPAGYAARLVTSGMCSCDLYSRRASASAEDSAAHLRRKYEKRGWSAAKIARAIEQAQASAAESNHSSGGLRPDVVERLEALCRAAGGIALLVHWYDADVESERLSLARAPACDCGMLRARALELVEDHVLVAAAPRDFTHPS